MTTREAIETINGAEISSPDIPLRKFQAALVALLSAARRCITFDKQFLEGELVAPVRCGKCEHWKEDEDSRGEFGECYCYGYKRRVLKRANGYCDRGVER